MDEDDWTGTPPEGRHSRDRARPDFWRRQWQAPAAWAGLLVAALTACGSASSHGHSAAALNLAGRSLSADLDAGRYGRACEALTAKERSVLAQEIEMLATRLKGSKEPELLARETGMLAGRLRGCVGFLAFARTLARATTTSTSLGREFASQLARLLPAIQIRGDTAMYQRVVEARYEAGRWRFEGRGEEPPFEVPTIISNGKRLFPPE
ncbi:MAG: hypothetical protein ACHP93_04820 [Solirubrobacterales bacterium]